MLYHSENEEPKVAEIVSVEMLYKNALCDCNPYGHIEYHFHSNSLLTLSKYTHSFLLHLVYIYYNNSFKTYSDLIFEYHTGHYKANTILNFYIWMFSRFRENNS